MKYTFTLFFFSLLVTFTHAQHTNVLITQWANPNEPSIMMDPKNPGNLVAGANTNKFFTSSDTGKTWKSGILNSPYGVWGDPVIIVDTNSDFYFFHLSNPLAGNWIDRIVCQKTTDNGQTWSSGTYMGLNGSKAQDKEWAIVDRSNNNIYVSWTQFDKYGSKISTDSSLILFSKSTDGGATWSTAKRISEKAGDCIDDDNTVEGAVPAVGPNGEVYIAWIGPQGIVFDKSTDEGDTWLSKDIFVSDAPGGWKYDIHGISRCNGLPVTVCDTSKGPNRGTIYINWTDQRNGTDDTDVWLVKSTDGGNTWSSPTRVNDDPPGKQQFLSWMTVDQVTGYLYFVFYDRRNHQGVETDVYMAVSTDGGNTFKNEKISEQPFTPYSSLFFGDYTNIVAHNGIVRPVWTTIKGPNNHMYTALVKTNLLLNVEHTAVNNFSPKLEQNYPNPVIDETYIKFKLRKDATVSISIYDITGRKKGDLINNRHYNYGKHVVKLSTKEYNLTKGIYFYELKTQQTVIRKKMMVLE